MSAFGNVHNFQYQPCWEQNVPQRTPNLIWQNCMTQPNYGGPFTQQPMQYSNWQNRGKQNNWRGNSNKQQRSKEPKYIGYCDVCDRGFSNEAGKSQHYQQHVKCEEPGCKFEAHPKIVAIHKRNQHGRNALPKMDTPEEIEQWRQDRKRNFPTATNIAKKRQMLMERQKNGNVLHNRRFDKMRGKNRRGGKEWFYQNQRQPQNFATVKENCRIPSNSSEGCIKSKNLLESQCVDLTEENGGDTSDGESQHLHVKKNITNALGSLMQDYASDDEEEEDGNAEKIESNKMQTTPSEHFEDGCMESSDTSKASKSTDITKDKINTDDVLENFESESKNQNSLKHERRTQHQKHSRNSDSKFRSRPSLLEMLLAPEIRRERNIILQCVRYIVKNDFFDAKS